MSDLEHHDNVSRMSQGLPALRGCCCLFWKGCCLFDWRKLPRCFHGHQASDCSKIHKETKYTIKHHPTKSMLIKATFKVIPYLGCLLQVKIRMWWVGLEKKKSKAFSYDARLLSVSFGYLEPKNFNWKNFTTTQVVANHLGLIWVQRKQVEKTSQLHFSNFSPRPKPSLKVPNFQGRFQPLQPIYLQSHSHIHIQNYTNTTESPFIH